MDKKAVLQENLPSSQGRTSHIEEGGLDAPTPAMLEIIADLSQAIAKISPKYFYDTRGSVLFEKITQLPEYYPTRTEHKIMLDHGIDIVRKIGTGRTVIELGAGNLEKAQILCKLIHPKRFVAVDISEEFLHEAAAELRVEFPLLDIHVVAADLTEEIVLAPDLPRQHRLVFYPGSSIGNFDPPQTLNLLSRIRCLLAEDGALLIGVDLLKDVSVLEAAYNDAKDVTAAFNLNVLLHVNRLIGSDFDPHQWCHRAFFNAADSRIEMHLAAASDVLVRWPGGGRRFVRGESIHTENSYKYRSEDFAELLACAGFHRTKIWTDEHRWFAVILAKP